jgi:carboxypeptidase A4
MRFTGLILSAASLAAAAATKVSYDGYQMFHVETATLGDFDDLSSKIAEIPDAIPLQACSHKSHLDVAIPANGLDAFNALNLDAKLVHEDLGAAIAEEGPLVPYERKSNC